MKKREIMKKGLVLILSAALFSSVLTGCGNGNNNSAMRNNNSNTVNESAEDNERDEDENEDTQIEEDSTEVASTDENLVKELRKKYDAAAADYNAETIEVARDEIIQMELGYNPYDSETSIFDSFIVYQDAELTQPIDIYGIDWDNSTGLLTIEPPFYGIAEVSSSSGVDLSHLSGNYLFDDENSGWGNMPQYYLATYVDVKTGEKLDKPLITVIKVKPEITQAPQLKFTQTENGEARLYWQEVPGADEYLVFMIDKFDMGFDDYTDVFATTKGTEWVCESDVSEILDEDTVIGMNTLFTQFYISDDSLIDNEFVDPEEDLEYGEIYQEYFGVIAVNENGASVVSNLLSAQELSHMLPNEMAWNSNDELIEGCSSVLDLPATMAITMCDGTTAQKVIDYDFENVVKEENKIIVTAKASGTMFKQTINVYEPNWDTLDADFATITKRQDELKNKGGNVDSTLTFDDDTTTQNDDAESDNKEDAKEEDKKAESDNKEDDSKKSESDNKEEDDKKDDNKTAADDKDDDNQKAESDKKNDDKKESNSSSDIAITANSAISEYIAINMLKTKSAIDLSGFPEAANMDIITDAFFEAQYQNPLILGVKAGSMDTKENMLYVEYDYDRETTAQKQEELLNKVDEVVDNIIDEDMSEAEKELAINEYLCENAVYDDAALENAEENDFYYVDEEFNDSFTAYGVLVNGVGVCASYSAAFKMLADAAGLESIVVTGYLDGSLPHAWNKVSVDGQWNIVDATNNDNETIPNALLNLSDDGASSTLTEDDRFVIDNNLYDYSAPSDDNEFYRMTGNYFEKDEIAKELASKLASEGSVKLRTDYDLDDETFYSIAQEVANDAGKDLSGFYWLGVINLTEQ